MKSVDACIFCDEVPCVCNQKSRPGATRATNADKAGKSGQNGANGDTSHHDKSDIPDKSASSQPSKKPVSFLDAMKNAAASAPKTPPPPPIQEKRRRIQEAVQKPTRVIPEVPDEELVFNAAIRNLAPLLHYKEQERYAAIISSKPHPHERRAIWKMRRNQDEQARESDRGDV